MQKALKILQEQFKMLNNDIDGIWINPKKIDEAIKELNEFIKRSCINCKYDTKKEECKIKIKRPYEKTFYCNYWESK